MEVYVGVHGEDEPVGGGGKWLWVWSLVWLVWLGGCGDATSFTEQSFIVKMCGVYQKAASSEGTYEPSSQTYQLTSVQLFDAEGVATELFEDTSPKSVRISSQSQRILQVPIQASWVGQTFKRIVITFDAAVSGVSLYQSHHTFTLSEPAVGLDDSLTITKGSDFVVHVQVLWRGTVVRDVGTKTDAMGVPDITVSTVGVGDGV